MSSTRRWLDGASYAAALLVVVSLLGGRSMGAADEVLCQGVTSTTITVSVRV
ncbi:hypothetical protein HMPREF1162_1236 [ [[Propionibacterium] namnetense SK182B-JCVI]|uniref:Uncharacterized protein n=1 Tax=[Propionibacterium] namnetense SK182B-JCVI TaxID=1051006 RepID=F9NUN2_9ACTN|nr:hypothetical protein HMPREF1162_1236 [ [[Propionibacterium] namnetense SK182B-JCVI]